MKQRIEAFMLALHIEYHWWIIMRLRKRMIKLFEEGESLSSDQLVRMNIRLTDHGIIAFRLQDEYEKRYCPDIRTITLLKSEASLGGASHGNKTN